MRPLRAQYRWFLKQPLILAIFAFSFGSCWSQKPLTSYFHSSWSAEDGLGAVFDIMQSPDGYLWLTTSLGIFRFDGVRFESVEQATDGKVSNSAVDSVFVSNSGNIWFSTRTSGMLLWKDHEVYTFPDRNCTPSLRTDGIVEARDGSLWMQARLGLAHLHGTTCDQVGNDLGYPGGFVAAILIDHRGTIWVQSTSGAILVLPEHGVAFRKVGEAPESRDFVFLHEAPDGSIWVADDFGLSRITNPKGAVLRQTKLSAAARDHTQFGNFAFSRDGSLWAGSKFGVSHVEHSAGSPRRYPLDLRSAEALTTQDGLTSNGIWKILEDHEKNIWIGSNGGLDKLRKTPFSSLKMPRGQNTEFGVLAGNDDDIWIGSRTVPLMHIRPDGKTEELRSARLITCLRRDRQGTIWAAGAEPTRLTKIMGGHTEVIHYPEEDARGVSGLEMDKNNDLWLLLFGGRTYRRSGNRWVEEDSLLGRKPGVLGSMTSDEEGNIWIAFSNKLVRWNGRSFDRFSFPDGLLNISVTTMLARGNRVWMGGTGGVSLFHDGHFHLLRCDRDDLPGRVSGLAESTDGDLWINGFSGVTHIARAELQKWLYDSRYTTHAEHFDTLDGLPGLSGDRTPDPSIVTASDGKLWFATTRTVAWLDPKMLGSMRNTIPPNVKVLAVTAGGRSYREVPRLQLPAHANNVRIDYTALSLAEPARVAFRYKLEGVDDKWQDAGTRRQAFYTKLNPGSYRFQVIASNNDGVWNYSGTTLSFRIAPALYQTVWFRTVCLLSGCVVVWLIIRIRISKGVAQVKSRLMERLSERERIAGELHDTLLQSVVGLTLQLQTATDQLPTGNPARSALELALQSSESVIEEGRQRIKDLRNEVVGDLGLCQAIEKIGNDCKLLGSTRFRLETTGRGFAIRALVLEEVLLVIREAVTNAFLHAHADNVTVRVEYLNKGLWISISDDGCGIDPLVLHQGRSGHWGLLGMKERTARIRGKLCVTSNLQEGTEVSLRVPADVAYSDRPRRIQTWLNELMHKTGLYSEP